MTVRGVSILKPKSTYRLLTSSSRAPHTRQERAFRLGVPPRVTHSGNKQTLLHAACSRGCLRTAKLVVRKAVYDSNPPFKQFLDARARDGQTALDVATRGGFTSTSEWLTALGAKANVTANSSGSCRNSCCYVYSCVYCSVSSTAVPGVSTSTARVPVRAYGQLPRAG